MTPADVKAHLEELRALGASTFQIVDALSAMLIEEAVCTSVEADEVGPGLAKALHERARALRDDAVRLAAAALEVRS